MHRLSLSLLSFVIVLALPAAGLAQTIPTLERAAGPCTGCAQDGWTMSSAAPDVIVGNGTWPGGTWIVSDVAGGPREGSNMTMTLAGGAVREAVSASATGLSTGMTYALSVYYQGATLTNPSVGTYVNGTFSLTVQGATTTYPTSTGDAWTEAVVTFVATGTTAPVVLGIGDLGTGSLGGFIVADDITIDIADSDGDGDPDDTDCAPMDDTIYAGAPDVVCDGDDNNCDGTDDDGYVPTATACGVGGCASTGMTTCIAGTTGDSCTAGTPAASDATCDGVDDDCDGGDDEDYAPVSTACGVGACGAAGVTSCVTGSVADSCTAGTPASDDTTCDGIDDDCDGADDEDYAALATTCGVGACGAAGTTSCVTGSVADSCTAGTPASDDTTCDGIDDDCDGADDEDYAALATTCGMGMCAATGMTSCVTGSVADDCSAGTPGGDDTTCDGVDDDCDGTDDEDYASIDTTCGVGECAASGSTSCVSGAPVDSCSPETPAADDATCDSFDDDCDGMVDEDGMCDGTDSGMPMTDGGGIGSDGGGIGGDGGDAGPDGGMDDGGCSCRVQARDDGPAVPMLPLALMGLLGVVFIRRRR